MSQQLPLAGLTWFAVPGAIPALDDALGCETFLAGDLSLWPILGLDPRVIIERRLMDRAQAGDANAAGVLRRARELGARHYGVTLPEQWA